MNDFIEYNQLKKYCLLDAISESSFEINSNINSVKIDIYVNKKSISVVSGIVKYENGLCASSILVILEYVIKDKKFKHSTVTDEFGNYVFSIYENIPKKYKITLYERK